MTRRWEDEDFCYVTTTGRRTERPHTIEIWFAARGSTIFILAGGGEESDTVRNLRADPRAIVRIRDRTWAATGRVADEGDTDFAREAIPRKYAHAEEGLEEWAATALAVAFDPSD